MLKLDLLFWHNLHFYDFYTCCFFSSQLPVFKSFNIFKLFFISSSNQIDRLFAIHFRCTVLYRSCWDKSISVSKSAIPESHFFPCFSIMSMQKKKTQTYVLSTSFSFSENCILRDCSQIVFEMHWQNGWRCWNLPCQQSVSWNTGRSVPAGSFCSHDILPDIR